MDWSILEIVISILVAVLGILGLLDRKDIRKIKKIIDTSKEILSNEEQKEDNPKNNKDCTTSNASNSKTDNKV